MVPVRGAVFLLAHRTCCSSSTSTCASTSIYGGRSGRTKAWIDLLGLMFFYMPCRASIDLVLLSLNFVYDSYVSDEMSSNAGGLMRWPV